MGVEDRLPPLNPPTRSKCGSSASTASNSVCPASVTYKDYYGPWTLASRIPIPPKTSKCERPYTWDDMTGDVDGSCVLEAPGTLKIDHADLNIFSSQQPSAPTPPGVSDGGANPGPGNPPNFPRSLNLPSDFVSQINRVENSAWSIGRTGKEWHHLAKYTICNTQEKTNVGGIFRVLGSDGSVQTFGDISSAQSAMPSLMNNLDKLAEKKIKDAHGNWNKLNSQITKSVYHSNDMVLDMLSVNYDITDDISLSIAPTVGYGVSTTATASQSVNLSVTQTQTQAKTGGRKKANAAGTGGGTNFGNATASSNQTKGDPQTRNHFRAGISIRATWQLGNWQIAGEIMHSRAGDRDYGGNDSRKTIGTFMCTWSH